MLNKTIEEIRKIEADKLITILSNFSIEMYNNHMGFVSLLYKINPYQSIPILLTGWVILNLEYISMTKSNDYRNCKKQFSLENAVMSFLQYENSKQVEDLYVSKDKNLIFKILLGSLSEQLSYQSFPSLFNRFNRNYYIFCESGIFNKIFDIDLNSVTQYYFSCDVIDYLKAMRTIWWTCSKNPNPLFFKNLPYKNLIKKIIKKYSCSYNEIRESNLKQLLLYAKPFIQTQKGQILSSNIFLVFMLFVNSLYWLTRDFYCETYKDDKSKIQHFPNKFGYVFEEYIKNLASQYFNKSKWIKLPEDKQNQADFLFDFDTLCMIIETKSSLLQLNAKQQVPSIDSIEKYGETIKKAYIQLDKTYQKMKDNINKPILKIILIYDELVDASICKLAFSEQLNSDSSYLFMTIEDFEILMYLYKTDKNKLEQILNTILSKIEQSDLEISFRATYIDYSINANHIWQNEKNYIANIFKQIVDDFNTSTDT